MKRVLIVEDDREQQEEWKEALEHYELGDALKLIQAFTIGEAIDAIRKHPDIDLVAIDGTLERALDGIEFAEHVEIWHEIPSLSISSNAEVRQMMLKAGCKFECEKKYAFRNILNILGIPLA